MIPKATLGFALGFGALLIPFAVAVQAQTKPTQQPTAPTNSQAQPASQKTGQVHSEGERIFAQNCSRCHNAPDGFSPRISGTVLRHMRVRAQLSEHDEKELLRFFNP
jgi:cytochrome c5